jgi:HEAT repeat protein
VNADCAQDDATNVLAEKLTDSDGHIQYYAADALGRLGPKARAAIPALLGALNDASSNFIRQHVADALKKIDPDAAAKVGIR